MRKRMEPLTRLWIDLTLVLIALASVCLPTLGDQFGNCNGCTFNKHKHSDAKAKEKLRPICGRRYTVEDPASPPEYMYDIGICISAVQDTVKTLNNTAVLQTKIKNKSTDAKDSNMFSLGSLTNTDIMVGANWIYLEYEGGEQYGHSCSQEHRRSIIMVTCLPGEMTGKMKWLEENVNKTEECHYLFELEHDAACNKEVDNSLSAGSIICIVLGCMAGAYLIIGGLYMRCVVGAKGLKQIPNYEFWRDFGNLQADGCDLLCRCGGREHEAKQYHGIGDHQIECANDDDHDEHLLPM